MGMLLAGLWLLPQSVSELAERLRSDRIEEREAATSALLSAESGAREALTPLIEDPDAEVSQRARWILETLELRSRIDPRLLAALPSLELALRGDNDEIRWFLEQLPDIGQSLEWDEGWASRAFARLVAFHDRFPGILDRVDLEALACRALVDLDEEALAAGILGEMQRFELRATIPDLLRLVRAESPMVRRDAVMALGWFHASEALSEFVRSLADPEEEVVEQASRTLQQVGVEPAGGLLIDLLRGELPTLGRRRALALLALQGMVKADDVFLEHLRHGDVQVRWQAMECLVSVAAGRCAKDVERLLEDPDAGIRIQALDVLQRIDARESVPAILRILKDPSVAVRNTALMAIARLGEASAAGEVARLVEDPEVRPVAIHALLTLDALNSLPLIRKYEKDPDPYVQVQVQRALRLFGD